MLFCVLIMLMEITKVTMLTQAVWYCRQLNHPKLRGQLHIQCVSLVLVFSQRESERSVQWLPELFHRQRLSKWVNAAPVNHLYQPSYSSHEHLICERTLHVLSGMRTLWLLLFNIVMSRQNYRLCFKPFGATDLSQSKVSEL